MLHSVVHQPRRLFCPSPLRGVPGGNDPLLPSRWWSFGFCLFSELCVCEWCRGDPAAPPSRAAPPVMSLCWPLSSILHGKIPVLEKWWRATNQRWWPLAPRLKPRLPLKWLSLPQMKLFAWLCSFLYYMHNGDFFFFTLSHLFIFNGFPGDFERLVVTYCLSLFRYLASTEMWKWRKTFILGHFWVTLEP